MRALLSVMSTRGLAVLAVIGIGCAAVSGCDAYDASLIEPAGADDGGDASADASHDGNTIADAGSDSSADAGDCMDVDHADCDQDPSNGCERDIRPVGSGGEGPCQPEDNCVKRSSLGHDYYLCPTPRSWDDARTHCLQQLNGDLAQISDAEENTFVAADLVGTSWIGHNDRANDGLWTWSSNRVPFWRGTASGASVLGQYANWSSGEPNGSGDCGVLSATAQFDDADCAAPKPYVCEVSPDACVDDSNKIDPGQCGCDVADSDADGDGFAFCNDECDDDEDKLVAGACGCGTAESDTDTDTDNDGTPDCIDNCDEDANKIEPGMCGCGAPDTDSDSNGTADCLEMCRRTYAQPGSTREATRKIKNLTGSGTSAAQFGVGGSDLGIPVRQPDGKIAYIFGDTFDQDMAGGPGWRSPILLRSDPGLSPSGIVFTSAAGGSYAKQLLNYAHTNGRTWIPSDAITIGDRMYLHFIVNEGLGNVQHTQIAYSDDNGENWTVSNARWEANENNSLQQLWTWERGCDGYVYVISTKFITRDQAIILHRVPEGALLDKSQYEPWGYAAGQWRWGNPATIILNGDFGELSLRRVEDKWVLAWFNAGAYEITVKVFDSPTSDLYMANTYHPIRGGNWGAENNTTVAQLYGGYIHPDSTLHNLRLIVSQWNTSANWPYRAMEFVTGVE